MYNYYAYRLYGKFARFNEVEGICVKNIFLISGKARHGKNAFAIELKEELEERGYKVFECAFADILKNLCSQYYGFTGNKDKTGRQILQQKGDMFRADNPDMFVNIVAELIKGIYSQYDFVLITDCRFKNELYGIKDKFVNSVSIRVIRPDFDNGLTEEQKSHKSETDLDNENFDFYVYNNKDVKDLRNKSKILIDMVFSPYLFEKEKDMEHKNILN